MVIGQVPMAAAAEPPNAPAVAINSAASPRGDVVVVRGRHLVLHSDCRDEASLREMAAAFDAAVPQWTAFWEVPAERLDDWSVDAFIIGEEQVFRQSGDLPPEIRFPFGYAIDGTIWVHNQSSDYYTRHLLLHEGVHALALELFDHVGPSWFAEGVAEMLGVHAGRGAATRVNRIPDSREATPYWGRFKLMAASRREHRIPSLEKVLDYPRRLRSDVESYGWAWAAMMLFSEYPEYRSEWTDCWSHSTFRRSRFTAELRRRLQSRWPIVQARWRLLCHELDYGFDWQHERVALSMEDPAWDGQVLESTVDARGGWQSCGVRFSPGTSLEITARGRCQLDDQPKPWMSEPDGVTIHYAGDRPLGQLLLCVLPNRTRQTDVLPPLSVTALGDGGRIDLDQYAWVLFRINDRLDDRNNNRGGYRVRIRRR